ncbi:MAG: O-antigen ligase family protein [Coriobacteriia bacterium]
MSLVPSRTIGLAVGALFVCVGVLVGIGQGEMALRVSGVLVVVVALAMLPAYVEAALIAVFFASPVLGVIEALRPEEINVTFYAVVLLTVAGFMAMLRSKEKRIDPLLVFLVWLMGNAVVATAVVKPEPLYLIVAMPLTALASYLVVTYGAPLSRKAYLVGFLVWAGVESCIAVLQTVFNMPGFLRWGSVEFHASRNYFALVAPGVSPNVRLATGTFTHFNQLAGLLCMAVPIALGLWLRRKSPVRGLYLALVVSGLVCTFSRGGLLGALVGCGIILFVASRGSLGRRLRLWIGILVAGLAVLSVESAIESYVSTTQNLAPRMLTWSLVLGQTLADPVHLISGAGLGYFQLEFLPGLRGVPLGVHSAPIELLVETGVVGLALGTYAVASTCLEGLRRGRWAEVVLSAGIVAFMLHQLIDNALFTMTGGVTMGLLSILMYRLREEHDGPAAAPDDPLRRATDGPP